MKGRFVATAAIYSGHGVVVGEGIGAGAVAQRRARNVHAHVYVLRVGHDARSLGHTRRWRSVR
jgi:hypothetical protein